MNLLVRTFLLALLLSACSARHSDPLEPVQVYLAENIGEANFSGQVFCAYDLLDMEVSTENAEVYVWALCADYYLENDNLEIGTACSLPIA